jgi:hypothetical protein
MSQLPEETLLLMTDWFRRVRESQQIHYACSNHFSRLHLLLGIPTVLLSTLAGTAVFASLVKELGANEKIAVGLISLLAASLASLQTFLNLSKRSDNHRTSAARYAGVRRLLEELKTFPPAPEKLPDALAQVRQEMNALAEAAPEVPARIKWRVDARVKARGFDGVYKLAPRAHHDRQQPAA